METIHNELRIARGANILIAPSFHDGRHSITFRSLCTSYKRFGIVVADDFNTADGIIGNAPNSFAISPSSGYTMCGRCEPTYPFFVATHFSPRFDAIGTKITLSADFTNNAHRKVVLTVEHVDGTMTQNTVFMGLPPGVSMAFVVFAKMSNSWTVEIEGN